MNLGEYGEIFIKENFYNSQIYFSDVIKVNEDSMFNARCCLYANRVMAKSDAYYCYIRRASETLAKGVQANNNASGFIDNKMQLAHERRYLICQAPKRGYKYSLQDIAGSCVMSALECVIKCPYNSWKIVKNIWMMTRCTNPLKKCLLLA